MRYISAIFCVLLLSFSASALAKSVFVNDQLRVGVRPEPSQVVAPIGVVLTGMKLEVLARQEPFIKIRSAKGVEGWIKDIYVTDKVPAILLLNDLEKQQKISLAKMQEIEKTKEALEKANSILNNQIDILKAQRAELQRSKAVEIITNASSVKGISILWLVLSVGLGIGVGYLWHRYQTMKRLGGLRV